MLTKKEFTRLPVFITTMSRWDGDRSSASLALAKVLSKSNAVYYIDYPYSWADVWRERKMTTTRRRMPALLSGKDYLVKVTGQSGNLQAATPRAVLPAYSLPRGVLYNLATAYNNRLLAAFVKRIKKEHNITDYLFLNSFNPTYLSSIDNYLEPTLSVYHSRDAIEEVEGHGLEKENECIRHYDLVMATSRRLCRNIGKRNDRHITYFPNGGDVKLFRTALEQPLPKPPELATIRTPVIGYTGAICQRIDYQLLVKIAEENRDKTIVLVGPRLDKIYSDVNLDDIPNIIFTGPKKIEQLPAYLQNFDCTIIPFLKNNLTAGIYPLKINEYLAAGKAVVTTNFSEDINEFKEYIYIANTHDEFLEKIKEAMRDNNESDKQKRLAAASVNSWEHRLELFWDLSWNAYQNKIKHAEAFSKSLLIKAVKSS
jgi:teichuronic acid biosynthesis glycosyltransferase TuaH